MGRKWKIRFKDGSIHEGGLKTSGWRLGVQVGFAVLSLVMGWQFYNYVEAAKHSASGDLPFRPPGVEGYLPISGLMGALDWIYQGTLNKIHPAATILFIIFVVMSLLLRKAFCGWICPVGLLSESLARLGRLIFKRNFRLPKYLDYFLQSLKYLILGFFVWAIFGMSPEELHSFIDSPYNKVADAKMLVFFLDLSQVGAIVILILAALSVLVHSFWCRYLCPYGALLGLFSWMSPVKVRRTDETCIDCGLCDKVCPSRLPVSVKDSITSVECIGCTDCVETCPVPDTLSIGIQTREFSARRFALMALLVFTIGYITAQVTGKWHNSLTDDEVRYHIQRMDGDEYGHPGR